MKLSKVLQTIYVTLLQTLLWVGLLLFMSRIGVFSAETEALVAAQQGNAVFLVIFVIISSFPSALHDTDVIEDMARGFIVAPFVLAAAVLNDSGLSHYFIPFAVAWTGLTIIVFTVNRWFAALLNVHLGRFAARMAARRAAARAG